MNKHAKDWDYDECDYMSFMKEYVENCIDAGAYRSRYFSMRSNRSLLSEEASLIFQKSYGDADDYDSELRMEYTIDGPVLRRRVAKALAQLEILGYRVEEKEH